MGGLFTALWAKLAAIVGWFGDLFVDVFEAGWDFLTDVICWVFDKGLGVAVSAMASLDVTGVTANISAWGSLPAEVLNILSLLGIGTASTIIVSAITIRLTLQLIPFVRLGS
jgi:hypothetical protein